MSVQWSVRTSKGSMVLWSSSIRRLMSCQSSLPSTARPTAETNCVASRIVCWDWMKKGHAWKNRLSLLSVLHELIPYLWIRCLRIARCEADVKKRYRWRLDGKSVTSSYSIERLENLPRNSQSKLDKHKCTAPESVNPQDSQPQSNLQPSTKPASLPLQKRQVRHPDHAETNSSPSSEPGLPGHASLSCFPFEHIHRHSVSRERVRLPAQSPPEDGDLLAELANVHALKPLQEPRPNPASQNRFLSFLARVLRKSVPLLFES